MQRDNSGKFIYPDWIVDAVPGAREALDVWADAVADAPTLAKAHREAIDAAKDLGTWRGEVGNAIYGPADHVSQADFDRAQARKRDAKKALDAVGRRGQVAYNRFHALMDEQAHGNDEIRQLAARRALEAQADAVAALAALREALDRRDEADEVAGSPGTAWAAHTSAPADAHNATAQAWHVLGVMVDHFDTVAQARTAAGERVPSLRTLADRQRAADEAAKANKPQAERRTAAGF